ncbi:G-type lectin S-receptor-like serine/threonine-protein kinase LECRK1 [Punica granatum]|uniref:Receptor-like serine/threonine-protein kinase n=2 Tax=Punica granatum TaxID=22663 RepID=A0A218Y288_PUNGR|nr:G-type lectin S-receptor-like serine/threonine-protein kinase LECRK1 [Punica granatum]OWM91383.1 hypothetical protein CDL15_Pgr017301 [Punica granatum]PKI79318.1 hypothetical protein CRG98_000263 [Punica granatum]
MATLKLACLLLLLFVAASFLRQTSSYSIRPGSSLSPSASSVSWPSPSRLFRFGFYPQGRMYAVGIWLSGKPNNTITWTASRDGPLVSSNSTIYFAENGTLVLRTETGREMPITKDLIGPATSASMLDTGNFVLYDNSSQVIWQSFDYPTDTILGGQNLSRGVSLVSSKSLFNHSSGRSLLVMQSDGNLVMYPVNSGNKPEDSYWSTATFSGTSTQLHLDGNGTLRLQQKYSGNITKIIANSSYIANRKDLVIHRATLDSDGNFRLYMHRFLNGDPSNLNVSLTWSALESDCNIKGFCGVNSYCNSSKLKDPCNCFPGFDFFDLGSKIRGCYSRSNKEERCEAENLDLSRMILRMDHIRIGGHPYSVLSHSVTECEESCRNDCHCEVALYFNGTCNKFKLPIIYGVMIESDAAMVLVKQLNSGHVPDRPPKSPLPPGVERQRAVILLLAATLGSVTLLCSLAAILTFYIYRSRVHKYRKLSRDSNLGLMKEFTLQSFSYKELYEATGEFKEELGRDSFGGVYYRGSMTILGETKIVAVKKLERVAQEGGDEFRAEMNMTGHTHHRNLVRLLGFCMEGSRKILVYEHMANGSLADLLFNPEARPSWRERVGIALQIARGILYLHEECELQIVHCNIKPQNILMDELWTARISDFSLAKVLMPNQTNKIHKVRGTRGYVAPEVQKNGLLSTKADIYSFGVVLLEIICCRANMEVNVPTPDEVLLATWVTNCYAAGELQKLVSFEYVDMKSLQRMVRVGLLCIQDDPNLRPPIKDVILMLEGIMDIPNPPLPTQSSDVL